MFMLAADNLGDYDYETPIGNENTYKKFRCI